MWISGNNENRKETLSQIRERCEETQTLAFNWTIIIDVTNLLKMITVIRKLIYESHYESIEPLMHKLRAIISFPERKSNII